MSLKINVEFHEKRSRNLSQPYIETRFHVEDLEAFLKFCAEEEWDGSFSVSSAFRYHMKDIKKSRAKRPHFDLTIKHKKVEIYPKENEKHRLYSRIY